MTDTIQVAFEKFHNDNPHVLGKLEELTTEWFASGHRKVGMKMLWEMLRWFYGTRVVESKDFRLNNNFTSRYARLLIERNAEWEGRIEVRALATERVAA